MHADVRVRDAYIHAMQNFVTLTRSDIVGIGTRLLCVTCVQTICLCDTNSSSGEAASDRIGCRKGFGFIWLSGGGCANAQSSGVQVCVCVYL